MTANKLPSEKGQSLVLVALGLLAFVAILALVLDGGNAYAAKRQAQNAADAGALAGATYMCKNHDVAGGLTTAQTYAIANGAEDPPEVYASLSSGTVVVTATVTKNTFFAGVIGFTQVSPRAVAEAACRPPIGLGVLPVAWACRSTVVGGMNVPGEDCAQIKIADCGGNPYDLDCTYVLMDSVKVRDNNKGGKCDPEVTDPNNSKYCYTQNDLVCSAHGPDINPSYGCSYVAPNTTDCDLNNDCVDELMTGGARSWLDLDGSGGGASDLTSWVTGSQIPPPIPPHKWIPTENGVTTSIFHTVASSVVGKDVILPVFNNTCNGVPNTYVNPETLAQCTYGPDDDRSIASSNANFHVITFSMFHVTCVQTGKSKVSAEPGYVYNNSKHNCNGHQEAVSNGSIDDNDKTIEGYFKELNLGGFSGPGDWFDTGTFTVILTR
jgi:hypothetical protein